MLGVNINDVRAILSQYHQGEVELEAKFGKYDRNFSSNVIWPHFDRARKKLQSLSTETILRSTVYRSGNLRKIVVSADNDLDDDVVRWEVKNRMHNYDLRDYGVRVSISQEVAITDLEDENIANFNPDNIRIRTRYSYLIADGNVRVDMTEVTMMGEHGNTNTYEIEAEYVGHMENLEMFNQAINNLFKWIYDTVNIYTITDKNNLIDNVNRIVGNKSRGHISTYPFVQARNLQIRDMVWGGLVGNRYTSYTVTHKTDGVRKLLIFDKSGMWLIYPNNEYNLIMRRDFAMLTGSIFDGELIPQSRRKDGSPVTQYWYQIFDTISVTGKPNIYKRPHKERMLEAQQIAKRIKTGLIYVDTKTFKSFRSTDEFYRIMRSMFDEQFLLPYENDGFMFTPEDTVYNPHSEKHELHDRVLTRYPDVCKWKPKEKMTIDFMIKWVDGGLDLYSYDLKNKDHVIFNGSDINPYNKQVDYQHEIIVDQPTGTIVEFKWDYDTNTFVPDRIRHDKTGANRSDVAVNNWDWINNPISEDTLKGTDFKLMFRYHNRIKKGLFDIIPGGSNILDIGTGRGGDVAKWRKLNKVVAVEPDEDNRRLLHQRLRTFTTARKDLTESVYVLPTIGQNSRAITQAVQQHIGGRVDAITLMLSMTFFWENSDALEDLVNTIKNNLKPGGLVIFLTANGDTIEQLFEPIFGGVTNKKVSFGNTTLTIGLPVEPPKGRSLHVSMPEDTIVGEQDEYLVRLGDLQLRLMDEFIKLEELHRAEGERFLSDHEKLFSTLYSFGYFSAKDFSPKEVKHHTQMEDIPEREILYVDVNLPQPHGEIPPVGTDVVVIETPQVPETIKPDIQPVPTRPDGPIVGQGRVKNRAPIVPPPRIPGTIVVPRPRNNILPTLPVSYSYRGNVVKGPARGDDAYQPITCTWFDNLVRIATIGDGSCFIHGALKGFFAAYQNTNSAQARVGFVESLRRDLSYSLGMENTDYPGHTYWETANNGQFVILLCQELFDPTLIKEIGIDYSFRGIQALFNSTSWLGDEVYGYISDMLNVNIFILKGTTEDLETYINTYRPEKERPSVCIMGNTQHYEVVAVKVEVNVDGEIKDMLQTTFYLGDPFLDALLAKFKIDPDEPQVRFSPDDSLMDALNVFTDETGTIIIPNWVFAIFEPDDPFILGIRRLQERGIII